MRGADRRTRADSYAPQQARAPTSARPLLRGRRELAPAVEAVCEGVVVGVERIGWIGVDREALACRDVKDVDPDGTRAAAPEQRHLEAVTFSRGQLGDRGPSDLGDLTGVLVEVVHH